MSDISSHLATSLFLPTSRILTVSAALSLALLVGSASCRSCTEVGCQSELVVAWPTALGAEEETEVCLEDRCVVASGSASTESVSIEGVDIDGDVATLTIRREERPVSQLDAPVAVFHPNGEDCPPSCNIVHVEVGADGEIRVLDQRRDG